MCVLKLLVTVVAECGNSAKKKKKKNLMCSVVRKSVPVLPGEMDVFTQHPDDLREVILTGSDTHQTSGSLF